MGNTSPKAAAVAEVAKSVVLTPAEATKAAYQRLKQAYVDAQGYFEAVNKSYYEGSNANFDHIPVLCQNRDAYEDAMLSLAEETNWVEVNLAVAKQNLEDFEHQNGIYTV